MHTRAMGTGFGGPRYHAEWEGSGGPHTQILQTEKACEGRKAGRVWRPSGVKAGYGGPRDERLLLACQGSPSAWPYLKRRRTAR